MSQTESCVHHLFETQAERHPSAVALADSCSEFSYVELNERANRLSHYLARRGIGPGHLVGLRIPRSARCVIAMLAVLKTGAAYVPLEDVFPARRLEAMARECGLRLVLTEPPLGWDEASVPVLSLEREEAAIAAQPGCNPGVTVRGDDVMYVPYTSGSTGLPKGISVPHRTVPGFFVGADYAAWGPGETCLHHFALSWDGHVVDIYPPLLSGGRLLIFEGDTSDPLAVAGFARDHGVTTLVLTTAAFNVVVAEDPHLLAGLRHLLVGGEAVSRAHVAKALRALPRTRLANIYGPVECTGISMAHVIGEEDLQRPSIPIGRQIGDRRVYIADERFQPIQGAGEGELCIGGPAVAHGYRGRAALTAERFVPDPFSGVPGARLYRTGDIVRRLAGDGVGADIEGSADGSGDVIVFIGRRDDQVKIRGVRVEPAEVTAVLREHPQVEDAAVVVDRTSPTLGARLIAYIVPARRGTALSAMVMAYLHDRLPAAMRPTAIVVLDSLPLTRTGKVDREALPAASDRLAKYAAPVTELEAFLAQLWGSLLDRPALGLDDNFFELGGHSLLASQALSRIRKRFGPDVPLRACYDSPTPRALAAAVERIRAGQAAPAPEIRPVARARVRRREEGTPT